MNERESVRPDVLSDMLEELGVRLAREQIAQLASDFAGHIEMEREQDSHRFSGPSRCEECVKKQRRIDELERRSEILERGCVRFARMPENSRVSTEHGRVSFQGPMR